MKRAVQPAVVKINKARRPPPALVHFLAAALKYPR